MINYPAVSADWQTGSRPTMCLPQVCCITDSSRPSLDPTIISPAALSNPLGDGCCCSSSSYICRIPLNHKDPCHSGSHDPCRRVTLWAVRTTAWPPPPLPPGCRRPQAAAPLPRRADADANNNTHKHVTSRRMLYTRGIKQADVKAHMAAFSRRRPLASF